MKQIIALLLLLVQYNSFSQNAFTSEKPPVFPNCESVVIDSLQHCFDKQVYKHIFSKFKVPERVLKEDYKGKVVVIFEVDTTGQFRVMYVDAMYSELKTEVKRVFSILPKIKPATYNGRVTYKQYSMPIKIPLIDQTVSTQDLAKEKEFSELEERAKAEFDSVNRSLQVFNDRRFSSQLNIQFIHSDYSRFDRQMNLVGTNSHTASKPFVYEEVSKYYDFNAEMLI